MSAPATQSANKQKTPPQAQPRTITGAEAVIAALVEEGVDLIYGYPGGAIMPIYDALYDYQDRVKHVLVRHEQGAVHAAQGYARVTGRVGVCFATSGPGATNLITGIADAQIDSTPLVCITGQVASHLLGTDAFQETDVMGISMPVTKWNYQITKASDIPAAIAKAFYIAKSGRPGPVLLDITKDAQFNKLEYEYEPCTGIRSYNPVPKARPDDIEAAAKLINGAKKPFILVGHGVLLSGAQEEFKTFVEKTGIPAASTLLGLSAFPANHPLNVGYLGMHGNYGPNVKTNQADVIIAVGMRFDDRVTGNLSLYAKQAKIVHIEIDPSEIGKCVKADVAINADAKEALTLLTSRVTANAHPSWLQEFHDCDAIELEKVIKKDFALPENSIKMANVVQRISDKTKGEAIVVTDVGQHQMVVSRYYKFIGTDTNVTSGGLGTMGFALPAAIGAKMGQPDKEVVAVIGDGGFQMTLQELGTIFQEQTAVKIVLLNNNFLGMVRQWQQLFFDRRYSFVELKNPNFIKIADGFGITARKVEHPSELDAAIDEMLAHTGPYFLEVVVEKEENVFPMVPTGASVADIRLE
ncbi:MAG: biosynthetic-type acetolactate synthase large subunit [Candidatus Kapaibacterium sp.]|nr:MAG: biosynthetic-type acetolactate synthase large subunit [Candidatus Kapabacteria bacterium]